MKYPILLATVSGLMFSTTAFAQSADDYQLPNSPAEYEYRMAEAELKVLEAQPLSKFIRSTDVDADGKLITPSDSVLQYRKDVAITEQKAVVGEKYSVITGTSYHGRITVVEDRLAVGKEEYEYNAAVTDLKVTKARDLSTFIQQGDDLGSSSNLILQQRKDAAIAEAQAVVDEKYGVFTDTSYHERITDNEEAIGVNSGRIDDNEVAIGVNNGRITIVEDRFVAEDKAQYEYDAAVTDLKVTEERALSTFIRNTDDPNNLPDDSVLQQRKNDAIAEQQAVVDQKHAAYTNTDDSARITSNTANIEEVVARISTAFEGFDDAAKVNDTLHQVGKNTAAIAHNTNRIASLEDDVENLKGGVAMAIAIANAPIVTNGENQFSLSGGVGYYEDAFALSLKAAFMPTNNIAITGSVASDMGNNFTAGAGVGFAF